MGYSEINDISRKPTVSTTVANVLYKIFNLPQIVNTRSLYSWFYQMCFTIFCTLSGYLSVYILSLDQHDIVMSFHMCIKFKLSFKNCIRQAGLQKKCDTNLVFICEFKKKESDTLIIIFDDNQKI